MSDVLREFFAKEIEESKEKGREEGREEGFEEGHEEGFEEGREEEKKLSEEKDRRRVWRMFEKGKAKKEIADDMELSLETVTKWLNGAKPVMA